MARYHLKTLGKRRNLTWVWDERELDGLGRGSWRSGQRRQQVPELRGGGMRVQSGSGGRGWGRRGKSSFHQEGPCLLCKEFRLDPVGVTAHSPGKQHAQVGSLESLGWSRSREAGGQGSSRETAACRGEVMVVLPREVMMKMVERNEQTTPEAEALGTGG